MKILITGTSQGIGKAIAEQFLDKGHIVIGIDRQCSTIENERYTHYECDVRDRENLPEIDDVEIQEAVKKAAVYKPVQNESIVTLLDKTDYTYNGTNIICTKKIQKNLYIMF